MPNGQACDDFVDYFERTWLNGNFSLSKWNVHLLDGLRTNNNLEGWHSRVKTLPGKADIATIAAVDETGVDETGLDETSSRRNRSRRNRYTHLLQRRYVTASTQNFQHKRRNSSVPLIGASLSEPPNRR